MMKLHQCSSRYVANIQDFFGYRSLRSSTEQMRFCGLAPCSFMSRSKGMHKDHVLVFILRVARST